MCFSAEASFGASIVILSIGIAAVKKSTTVPQRVFASIPFLFSVQQFTEGILWRSLDHSGLSQWVNISTYTFLFFAQVAWPVITPLSIRLLEKDKTRKKILNIVLVIGIAVSAILGYGLLNYKVQSAISCNHIQYDVEYPGYLTRLSIFYFIATVISPVISSIKKIRLLGILIFIGYTITRIFYENYLISVWCYFAALISFVVLLVVIQLNQPPESAGIQKFVVKNIP